MDEAQREHFSFAFSFFLFSFSTPLDPLVCDEFSDCAMLGHGLRVDGEKR